MLLNSREQCRLKTLMDGNVIGKIPFGYKRDKVFSDHQIRIGGGKWRNPIVVNEEEALIVKDVFELYITGGYSIETLNEHIKEKYNIPFHERQVYHILFNQFYIGKMKWKDSYFTHNYPPIINLELFNKAQEMIEKKKRYLRKLKRTVRTEREPLDSKIRPGVLKNLKSGFWVTVFPLGYKNIKKGVALIDEKESKLVKDIFEAYSSGIYSIMDITRMFSEERKITHDSMHRIICNKFYIGIMTFKGIEFPHNYPTFISQELFDKCSMVMKNISGMSSDPGAEEITKISPIEQQLTDQEQRIYNSLSLPLDLEDLSLSVDLQPSALKGIMASLLERNVIKLNEYKEYMRAQ